MRVAVVQGGVSEKTIATKAYQTTVNMTESGSEPFTLVAEDLIYPAPSGAVGDTYIFYIGFDPQALKPERPRREEAVERFRAKMEVTVREGHVSVQTASNKKAGAIISRRLLLDLLKPLSSAWRELRRCPWRAGRRRPSP